MDKFSHQVAPDGSPVNVVHLSNSQGLVAAFMDWGATWLSCSVPMPGTSNREVLLRSPSFSEHLQQTAYFGATVGRYANRISNGSFIAPVKQLAKRVQLSTNEAANTLHGGPEGFDRRRWRISNQSSSSVTFELQSDDGDQGFPGNLQARATYHVTAANHVVANYYACTDQPCPVNLTNHAYFNLDPSHDNVLRHSLWLAADNFLPVSLDGIPVSGLKSVAATGFDFRQPKTVGADLLRDPEQKLVGGYDHGFLLNIHGDHAVRPAAQLRSSDGYLQLDVLTNKPALQVYSGNYLEGTLGADGQAYGTHAGIALETAFLPDSPNHPQWPQPSCLLMPGEDYHYSTQFHFSNPQPHSARPSIS